MTFSPTRRFGAAAAFTLALSFPMPMAAAAADEAPAKSAASPSDAKDAAKEDAAKDAPRHGARQKGGDGTLVVYDRVIGAWLVPGQKDTYWIDGRYWQYSGGLWLVASAAKGPWELTAERVVPEVARDRHAALKGPVTVKLPEGGEAVYDPKLKAYKVAGQKGVFLHDGLFHRYDDGVWLSSPKVGGPWAPGSARTLPPPLRKALPVPDDGQKVTLPSGDVVRYEAATKLFLVEGRADTVLFDGTFWEKKEERWFSSPSATKDFKEVEPGSVPVPVRMKYRKEPLIGGKPKPAKDGAAAKGAAGAGQDAAAKKKNGQENATPAKKAAAGSAAGKPAKDKPAKAGDAGAKPAAGADEGAASE